MPMKSTAARQSDRKRRAPRNSYRAVQAGKKNLDNRANMDHNLGVQARWVWVLKKECNEVA